jgi:hypothetical protein
MPRRQNNAENTHFSGNFDDRMFPGTSTDLVRMENSFDAT